MTTLLPPNGANGIISVDSLQPFRSIDTSFVVGVGPDLFQNLFDMEIS